ncbi:MAG: phage tail assembly chaperone [Pseudomonadota bacterium]
MKEDGEAQTFPWADWFRFATLTLGLTPVSFWQLSVCEWTWLLNTHEDAGPSPQDINALRDLFLHYPDENYG